MEWVRRNFIALVIVAALIGSFIVQSHEADLANTATRVDNIASCVRENARSALNVAWEGEVVTRSQEQANEARQPSAALVRPFERLARGAEAYLAIARYIKNPTKATETEVVVLNNGTTASVLTPHATGLIEKGCVLAFHGKPSEAVTPPIPVHRVLDPNRESQQNK